VCYGPLILGSIAGLKWRPNRGINCGAWPSFALMALLHWGLYHCWCMVRKTGSHVDGPRRGSTIHADC